MSGIGEETPGIRQHSDEAGEVPQICKGGQLVGHALFMVIEPPCASLLDFCCHGGILETAKDGADGGIVVGIQAVNNGLGKRLVFFHRIQEIGGLGGRRIVIDAVVAGVGTEFRIHVLIVVALCPVVELHDPVALMVFAANEKHKGGFEF